MAKWRGDGLDKAKEAVQATSLDRKVELLTEAVILMSEELEWAFSKLGPENFSEGGLKEIRGESKCLESHR